MRTRQTVTGGFTTPNVRESRGRSCGGSWGAWGVLDTTYTGIRKTKTIKDTLTPGFHALRKCGGALPLNPVEISTITEERRVFLSYTYGSGGTGCPGTYPLTEIRGNCFFDYGKTLSVPSVDENIQTAMVNEAIARVNSATLDLLTAAAETKDLKRTFKHALTVIGKYGTRAATKARSLRELHHNWLAYRYGWMPMIYTLQDAVKAHNEHWKHIVEGKASQSEGFNLSNNHSIIGTGVTTNVVETLSGSIRYGGFAIGEVNPLLSKYGLDPIVTAYELLTLSFVLDWFIGVGSYIQSISPFGAASNVQSMMSLKTVYQHDYRRVNVFGNYGSVLQSGSGGTSDWTITEQRYVRGAHGGGFPGWNPRFTPERAVDLVALVLTQKARIFRAFFK
jgi:hypothetical protein